MITQTLSAELQSKEVRCHCCLGKLEAYYQKRSTIKGGSGEILHGPGIHRIYHPRHSCLLRFESFGEGATELEAWEQARATIANLTKQMSTRSITTIQSRWETKEWETHANIYRHHDGHLEGHGLWLHEFLKDITVINGITGNERGRFANGPGRLTAQLVSALQEDGHSPDLVSDSGPRGQEYHYFVMIQFGPNGGTLSLKVLDGPKTFFGGGGEQCNNILFEGTVQEYGEFLATEAENATL